MLLAIDIGNSSIKFGIFESEILVDKFLIPTKRDYTVEELIFDRLRYIEERFFRIDSVVISSVVPELDDTLRKACADMLKVTPVFIDHGFDFGLKIKYEPIDSVGTDRLVNATAAAKKYGTPVIVCSFGTATTIDAVNAEGTYLGGTIAPGMNTMADALHSNTSKLPHVPIQKPENIIGSTTEDSIRSGVFFGYIGLVEGLITLVKSELLSADEHLPSAGTANAKANSGLPCVVATGGFARIVGENCALINIIDDTLMLDGLRLLYDRQNASRSVV